MKSIIKPKKTVNFFQDDTDGGDPFTYTSLRGEVVEIYGGRGLYQNDSITKAVMFRGFDWANLVVCLPLFIMGIYLYQRGHIKGKLMLGSIFTYLAYNYCIGVMGNAFNIMFLVWTGLFSTGLFGIILVLKSVDISSIPQKLTDTFPRKSLSIYMIILGLFLPIVYLTEIISAYITASPPASLTIYTTLELAALEIGIMAPLHLIGGVLLWQKKAWGYTIAILLAFTAAMTFISLSVFQFLYYFSFHQGNIADIVRMLAFAMIASGFSLVIFKRVMDK
jgi:uncharacterized membrane protein (DUF2068 family)